MIWHQSYWCPFNTHFPWTGTRDTWKQIIFNCISIPIPEHPAQCIIWRITFGYMTYFIYVPGYTSNCMSARVPYVIQDLRRPSTLRRLFSFLYVHILVSVASRKTILHTLTVDSAEKIQWDTQRTTSSISNTWCHSEFLSIDFGVNFEGILCDIPLAHPNTTISNKSIGGTVY